MCNGEVLASHLPGWPTWLPALFRLTAFHRFISVLLGEKSLRQVSHVLECIIPEVDGR